MPQHFRAWEALSWLYQRPIESPLTYLESRFKQDARDSLLRISAPSRRATIYGDTTRCSRGRRRPAATNQSGLYRNITGNSATARLRRGWAIGTPAVPVHIRLAPASDVLMNSQGYIIFPVSHVSGGTRIGGLCAAILPSFGRRDANPTTSGPHESQGEAVGARGEVELPLLITDIHRAGRHRDPTKPEQADLLQSMYGTHGESPIPIIAASTPADCSTAPTSGARQRRVKYRPG